jgi:hypothetical protein
MKPKPNRLSFEALEERRMMAIFIAGENYHPPPLGEEVGFVAPPQSGFSPIALPAGITPPGVTELPPPASGELPPGMPNLSGVAETNAVALAVGWMYTHENAVGDVTESITATSYTVSIDVRDGADFFRYRVGETIAQIAAEYVVRDGPHSEILASYELTGPLDGGFVYAQFDNNDLTAMAIHSETGGASTVWVYPEVMDLFSGSGSSVPGLSPGGLASLDALVSAHLEGPGAGPALDTFHAAVDEYFALSVPEPSTLALGIMAAGAMTCLSSRRSAAERKTELLLPHGPSR